LTGSADLSGFKRELDDLRVQQSAVDKRVQGTLENVHAALETMVARLASIEGEAGAVSAQTRPALDGSPRTTRVKAPAAAARPETPAPSPKAAAKRADEADEGRPRPASPSGAAWSRGARAGPRRPAERPDDDGVRQDRSGSGCRARADRRRSAGASACRAGERACPVHGRSAAASRGGA